MKTKIIISSTVFTLAIILLIVILPLTGSPKQLKSPLITPEIYERDKRQVADCIMRNIEYIRANHHVNSIVTSDVANFYEPYTVFYNEAKERYLPLPISAYDYLKVTTDTIIYSDDGLKCFIFVVLEEKTIEGQEYSTVKKGENFDAKSFVGVREQLNDSITIYPFVKYNVFGMASYKSAVKTLKHFYFNRLKGDYLSASVYMDAGRSFEKNVGEQGFFDSVIFQYYNDSTFFYQYNYFDLMQYHYLK